MDTAQKWWENEHFSANDDDDENRNGYFVDIDCISDNQYITRFNVLAYGANPSKTTLTIKSLFPLIKETSIFGSGSRKDPFHNWLLLGFSVRMRGTNTTPYLRCSGIPCHVQAPVRCTLTFTWPWHVNITMVGIQFVIWMLSHSKHIPNAKTIE